MKKQRSSKDYENVGAKAKPFVHEDAVEIQPYGMIVKLPIALSEKVCAKSVENLNQVLADTMTLRDLYKKHHWQVAGHTFYQLHLLFDKHFGEQSELVDTIAERIQLLGGISLAMAADIAETTMIPRPPRGREEVPVQISRLLHAHEVILLEARSMAKQAAEDGDDGTNDLLVSDIIRTNELQVWFLAEHLVDVPLVRAD
ncbi:MAG: DNA starvation/stationary phase protection protein [Thermodesulfobacteriota bacterium]